MKSKRVLQVGLGQLGVPLSLHLKKFFPDIDVVSTREAFSDLQEKSYDCAFICVQDAQIKGVINQVKAKQVVHFSGANYFKEALGVHPVFSFSKNQKQKIDFSKIQFVADGPLPEFLKKVFPRAQFVSPEHKKIYHGFLSVTANSFQLMSFLMGEEFSAKTGLDKSLLKDIVIQSLFSEKEFGEESFSGPWVRGERELQNKNIAGLNSKKLQVLNEQFQKWIEVYNGNERS